MYCHRCGNEVEEGTAFCPRCGVSLRELNDEDELKRLAYVKINDKSANIFRTEFMDHYPRSAEYGSAGKGGSLGIILRLIAIGAVAALILILILILK